MAKHRRNPDIDHRPKHRDWLNSSERASLDRLDDIAILRRKALEPLLDALRDSDNPDSISVALPNGDVVRLSLSKVA